MVKRKISLYFSSITIRRSFQSIWVWLTSLLIMGHARRRQLHQVIKEVYCPHSSDVFSFGSGRSALTACLRAAGIKAGDEVLLSAYTCLAVPTAVIAAGAVPVYVDIDSASLNVEANTVFANLSPRVRAVVVQHTLGKPADVHAIVDGARARGLLVIEDCALSVGSTIDGRYVGTFADAAILSMELSKTLTCGWGDILIVNNKPLATAVAALYSTLQAASWWSSTRDLWQTVLSSWCYWPTVPFVIEKYIMYAGFKSRIFRASTPTPEFDGIVSSNFMVQLGGAQAAVAQLQWGDFVKVASSCENNARFLRTALAELGILTPGSPVHNEISVTPRVSFLVTDRALAIRYFGDRGIELGQWFDGPLSPIPTVSLFNYEMGNYPAAEKVASQVVNLPCHSRLTDGDLRHIVTILEKFTQEHPGSVV